MKQWKAITMIAWLMFLSSGTAKAETAYDVTIETQAIGIAVTPQATTASTLKNTTQNMLVEQSLVITNSGATMGNVSAKVGTPLSPGLTLTSATPVSSGQQKDIGMRFWFGAGTPAGTYQIPIIWTATSL